MRLVVLADPDDNLHEVVLRHHTARDSTVLLATWAPALERGPSEWKDRGWKWDGLTDPSELAFDIAPEWLVLADEGQATSRGDLLGVIVTSGPVLPANVGLDDAAAMGADGLVWVEYIALAPSIRPKCPAADVRIPVLKPVGPELMLAAIDRSRDLGCEGRIGLHAEGEGAKNAYTRWKMRRLDDAAHRAGGRYPVFFGSAEWATDFETRLRRRGGR